MFSIIDIPWYFAFIWAVLVTIFWRYKFGDPVNHWIVCGIVFVINYFFFLFAFIAFFAIAIFEKTIVRNNNRRKNNGI